MEVRESEHYPEGCCIYDDDASTYNTVKEMHLDGHDVEELIEELDNRGWLEKYGYKKCDDCERLSEDACGECDKHITDDHGYCPDCNRRDCDYCSRVDPEDSDNCEELYICEHYCERKTVDQVAEMLEAHVPKPYIDKLIEAEG